ncbi:MAG: DNA polymerase, partial [Clostridiales bacterium]|nr:DNA polymerase [Clostridiales bacterium]
MKTLSIDIETYSSNDLKKCGMYKYCEADDFEILLFAYSADGAEVQVIDLAGGEKIPDDVLLALEDDDVIKYAYNAMFERVCLSRYLDYPTGEYLEPYSWRCTMVWAATLGLPLSLESVGAVLGLEHQKMSEGKNLIRYFCVPCKPTKANGNRTRNLPIHASDKWEIFKAYNKRDVEAEMAIQNKLSRFPVSENVWDEYHLDQEINDRGITLDMTLVKNAIAFDEMTKAELNKTMKDITELENPNSVLQMKEWLAENGLKTDSLDKKAVSELLKTAPPKLAKVLELRQQLAKSSVKKYQAMQNAACSDNRARGMFQFYGANRSGRFSGRLIQLQNLPQNHLPDLEQARELVRIGDYENMSMLYDNIPDVLSQLIRTAFIPYKGGKFIVSDFSAIEARVIAWIAGEKWRLDVFKNGGDIYCASASQMFKVPVEKHGINSELRQKGKIAELALGYGGSVGALKSMGALEMELAEDELKPLVDAWRTANPHIVRLWWDIDSAVKRVVKEKAAVELYGLKIFYKSGIMFIKLPSGRCL